MKIAIIFPTSTSEINNSGVARLEMFEVFKKETIDIYHFGKSNGKNEYSIGDYRKGSFVNFFSIFKLIFLFWKNNRNKNYDVIWATAPPIFPIFFALVLKCIFKKILIVDVRDPVLCNLIFSGVDESSMAFKLVFFLEKLVYKNCDKICVVTPEIEEFIREKFEINENKFELVYNAVLEKHLNNKKMGKVVKVFYAGSFSPYHVMDEVLVNIKNNDSKRDFVFEFYGYKKDRDNKLDKLVSKNVKLFESVDRETVFQKMKDSDIVLIPIYMEGKMDYLDYAVPLKIYEALGESKPILLFGGTKASTRLIEKHKIGVRCKMDDNIYEKLEEIVKMFEFYRDNCNKTFYSRKIEGEKMRKIFYEKK